MGSNENIFSGVNDGASPDTIAARNFLREVAGGTSVHSDYGRYLVLKLKAAAEGKENGGQIKDEKALQRAARLYGVKEDGRGVNETALELARLFLNEFTEQEGCLKTLELAPKKRQAVWETTGIKPNGIDRMVVEAMRRSSAGVDGYLDLLHHALRVSLADGWGGLRMASIVSDILKKEKSAAGISVDTIKYVLGGSFRASLRPLNDAIIQNRILGVVGIVRGNNSKQKTDDYTNRLITELIKRNILVLQTGGDNAEKLKPETAVEQAGQGLKEVCEAIGVPPVLFLGGCEDNIRILELATEIIFEGGLGDDLATLPVVGAAPDQMNEEAIAIGCYFAASGIDVVLGHPFSVSDSQAVNDYLCGGMKEEFGAGFHLIEDPMAAADRITEMLNQARDVLGINKKAERKLFDMKDRRAM